MREIFTYGSVGGASGNRCSYLEPDRQQRCFFLKCCLPHKCCRLRKVLPRMLAAGEFIDKWTVSSAALRTRSTYRGCRVPPTSLIGSRSRSTYQGRWSRLRFSALAEKKLPFSASACDSRGSTAALCKMQ
ncbi:hypothetical protein BuS5_00885 [Desulfosarcina sp. BuS5]|nr:hypothetical protein BuS5_00885 [Desulfosarcina sp. BuS5]